MVVRAQWDGVIMAIALKTCSQMVYFRLIPNAFGVFAGYAPHLLKPIKTLLLCYCGFARAMFHVKPLYITPLPSTFYASSRIYSELS